MGDCITGPLTSSMSKGTPKSGRGVRMSEKMMTSSGLKAWQGCKEISTMRSVVSDLSLKEGFSNNKQKLKFYRTWLEMINSSSYTSSKIKFECCLIASVPCAAVWSVVSLSRREMLIKV